MQAERWQQIEALFHAVLEVAPERRAVFLQQACRGDESLRAEVGRLLANDSEAQAFMRSRAMDMAARALAKDRSGITQLTGKTLLHYRISEKLGAGGMGVVYKARDTHLDRFVAVKTLPPEGVADPERKRRFIQEAKAASALNHPNIITIYDIDQADGIDFIAMEYVAGKTLDQRIGRRGLRLNEALKYAVQVADALAKAHAAGIVHRDLKPTNIMVNEDGLVKVLDFGLAKLTEQVQGDESASTATVDAEGRPITEEGVIVGTVAYMSPEQAEGKKVDARSDIFTLGSVLYEMMTGQKAFQGTSRMSTLSAILHQEPKPVSAIAPTIPSDLEKLINRCLRKDPEKRFQHMDDVRVALLELKEDSDLGKLGTAAAKGVTAHSGLWWTSMLAGMSAIAVIVVVAGWFWLFRSRLVPAESPIRVVPLTTYTGIEGQPAFSPDGKELAFAWRSEGSGTYDIYRKLIGPGEPLRLTTDPANHYSPAWSPDGRFIAFMTLRSGRPSICRIPALGGPEEVLGQVGWWANSLFRPFLSNLAWTLDSKSLIVPDSPAPGAPTGLFLLSVDTGRKQRLTTAAGFGGFGDVDPALSPDGRHLAFVRHTALGQGDIYLLALTGDFRPAGEPQRLTFENRDVFTPAWTGAGDIVFSSGAWLSERRLSRVQPRRIDGPAEYHPQPVPFGENASTLALSTVSRRLVYARESWNSNLYRVELAGKSAGTLQKLIVSTWCTFGPNFSRDGSKIAFHSTRSGSEEIWTCNADGTNMRQLTTMAGPLTALGRWSPDGTTILFQSYERGDCNLYLIGANGGAPRRITDHPAHELEGSWSQDGRWIYFHSNRTGRMEVYRMPASGGNETQLTRNGGSAATESVDGKWVYYVKEGSLWRIPAAGGGEIQVIDRVGYQLNYAVVEKGIYFLDAVRTKNLTLYYFDFATRTVTPLLETGRPATPWPIGMAISPDLRWILFPLWDRFDSDLMLVENFR